MENRRKIANDDDANNKADAAADESGGGGGLEVVDLEAVAATAAANSTTSNTSDLLIPRTVHYIANNDLATPASAAVATNNIQPHEHNRGDHHRGFICNHVRHTNYVSPLTMPYRNDYTFDRHRRAVQCFGLIILA